MAALDHSDVAAEAVLAARYAAVPEEPTMQHDAASGAAAAVALLEQHRPRLVRDAIARIESVTFQVQALNRLGSVLSLRPDPAPLKALLAQVRPLVLSLPEAELHSALSELSGWLQRAGMLSEALSVEALDPKEYRREHTRLWTLKRIRETHPGRAELVRQQAIASPNSAHFTDILQQALGTLSDLPERARRKPLQDLLATLVSHQNHQALRVFILHLSEVEPAATFAHFLPQLRQAASALPHAYDRDALLALLKEQCASAGLQ